MLINRLLAVENDFGTAIKNFFTELFYGGSDMQYENFSFGNPVVTYRTIIIALAFGLIIASAMMIYNRSVLGKMVRSLANQGAVSAENAKTLDEIGLGNSRAIKRSLKSGALGRMIYSVERTEHDEKMREAIEGSDEKGAKGKAIITNYIPHPERDRYYIPEDRAEEMVALFSEKGSGLWGFITTVLLCGVGVALLFKLVPWFIGLIDKTI